MKASLENLSVMIAIPGGRPPEWPTAIALASTISHCYAMGVPCVPSVVRNCSIITKARDELVDMFLASDANRLFWIDSDMDWTAAQFVRLLGMSTVVEVVGASYPMKVEKPTFCMKVEDRSAIERNDVGLFSVQGMGLGFTVLRREVVEALAATKPRAYDELSGETFASVFRTDIDENGRFRGEDIAFFADILDLGYKVWLDPTIDLGHYGTKRYGGRFMDGLKAIETQEVCHAS